MLIVGWILLSKRKRQCCLAKVCTFSQNNSAGCLGAVIAVHGPKCCLFMVLSLWLPHRTVLSLPCLTFCIVARDSDASVCREVFSLYKHSQHELSLSGNTASNHDPALSCCSSVDLRLSQLFFLPSTLSISCTSCSRGHTPNVFAAYSRSVLMWPTCWSCASHSLSWRSNYWTWFFFKSASQVILLRMCHVICSWVFYSFAMLVSISPAPLLWHSLALNPRHSNVEKRWRVCLQHFVWWSSRSSDGLVKTCVWLYRERHVFMMIIEVMTVLTTH